jgi:hypothetical protein
VDAQIGAFVFFFLIEAQAEGYLEAAIDDQAADSATQMAITVMISCGMKATPPAPRMIAKAEHNVQGANPRFVVTNLRDAPQALYERMYCARGDMENRIKECQLGLFADRTSCHLWWPNQFRLLLASLAYVLMERLRTLGLAGTDLARAQVWTLRCRLLKVGAVIVRNTRRIRFFLASAFPQREAFCLAAQRFASG